jgi:hypothetical protein
VRAAPPHRLREYRRLARRDLASLLRYKFLHEYGYDKARWWSRRSWPTCAS